MVEQHILEGPVEDSMGHQDMVHNQVGEILHKAALHGTLDNLGEAGTCPVAVTED